QSVVQNKLVQPPHTFIAEPLEARSRPAGGGVEKSASRTHQQWQLARTDLFVIHRACRSGQPTQTRSVNPALFGQALQANQQWIAGKSRGGRVWWISVRGRSQRQYLPHALSCCGEKV